MAGNQFAKVQTGDLTANLVVNSLWFDFLAEFRGFVGTLVQKLLLPSSYFSTKRASYFVNFADFHQMFAPILKADSNLAEVASS